MHRLKPYRDCPQTSLPVEKSLEGLLINIHSSASLDREEIKSVGVSE